ncbi:unnamed protein product [Malus baccata var. baccata]
MEKKLEIFDAKFDMLLQRIPGSQVAVQQPLQRPRYDPYSNFYNPGRRDHCNLKWDRYQLARPQFQQQLQQLTTPKATWEIAIEKLANTTSQEIQNLHASMKNKEKQIEQIALQVSERAPGTFPSQTVPNPRGREECNAVRTLRSSKSYDNRHENCAGNSQAAEHPQTKSAIYADFGLPLDKSEYTAKATTKIAEREGELKPTSNIIQLADRSITYPRGIIEDVIVKVDKLYLPADFMVLDMDEDLTTPIILGRPFLVTARTLIDVEAGTLTFRVKDQTVVFRLFEESIHLGDKQECMRVDALDGLPNADFMTRSSTDHLSIKPPNLIRDCISPKMQQQSVQHNVQPINIKKKHDNLPGSPNFKKIQPSRKGDKSLKERSFSSY